MPDSPRRRFVRRWLPALLLVFVAAAYRFPALDESPPSLFRDELEKGYTAWELWSTGRCGRLNLETGRVSPSGASPLFIDVYGVRTSGIYQWLSAPFVGLGGLNAITTRLAAALAGTLAVLFTFLWVRRTWGGTVALWAGFWLAVSPWHVVFSRWAQQGITEPLWLVLMVYGFQRGKSPAISDRARAVWWGLSGLAAGVAFYAYAVGRVFVPLFGCLLLVSHWRVLWRHWKGALPGVAAFLAIGLPVAWVALGAEGAARFERISVFGQTDSIPGAIGLFLGNWLRHFDPRYLFLHGDGNPRHGLPGLGLFTLAEAPLLVVGVVVLLRRRRPWDRFVLGWILLGPVSASLTVEGIPHALRSIVGLPAWPVVSGVGMAYFLRLLGRNAAWSPLARRWAPALLAVLFVGSAAFLSMRAVYRGWPIASAMAFEWPAQTVTQALVSMEPESGGEDGRAPGRWLSGFVPYAPHRLLFHGRVPPREWQTRGMEALPANPLPPVPAGQFWSRYASGDWVGILPPDMESLPPGGYEIESAFALPWAVLDEEDLPVGAVIRKTDF